MSREIKFRAWDKEGKRWAHIDLDNWESSVGPSATLTYAREGRAYDQLSLDNYDPFIWMQWTGLTDRNGVEIWEGDLVKYHRYKGSYELHQIIYEERAAAFLLFGATQASRHPVYVKYLGDIAKAGKDYDVRTYELCEVIGNIYEHSHLLGANQ